MSSRACTDATSASQGPPRSSMTERRLEISCPNADSRPSIDEHVALAGRLEELLPVVRQVVAALISSYTNGGRVYTFGNGGSAADSLHFAEELVARYQRERRPLAAQSLAADSAVLTCIANDFEFDELYARQVRAFARAGDVVIGFTTSGRSPNVVRGLSAA